MAEKTNEELQETIVRIESGKKNLEALIQQSRLIETTLIELGSTVEALEQLKKNKPGTEILVPIGGDNFVKASLKDTENVLVGIGAKISVERNVDEAIKTVKERAQELGKAMARARENAVRLDREIDGLNEKAQQLLHKAKK